MGGNRSGDNWRVIQRVAERVGFEPRTVVDLA